MAVVEALAGLGAAVAAMLLSLRAYKTHPVYAPLDDNLPLLHLGEAQVLHELEHVGIVRVRADSFTTASTTRWAMAESRALFAANTSVKESWPVTRFPAGPIARGYIPFGRESGVRTTFYEVKEGFALSLECADENARHSSPLHLCNAWPEGHGRFREASLAALQEQLAGGRAAVGLLSAALSPSQEARLLSARSVIEGAGASVLRIFNYLPAASAPRLPPGTMAIGSSPHRDWHLISVITDDNSCAGGGLEFLDRSSGAWRHARLGDGEAFFIVGELLQFATGGRLHAPVHRVRLPCQGEIRPEGASRVSFTLFLYPRPSDTLRDWWEYFHPPGISDTPEKALHAARAAAANATFNTLFADEGHDAALDEPFGDVLYRKWTGVERQTGPLTGESGSDPSDLGLPRRTL